MIKKEDIVKGAKFEVLDNRHLKNGPALMVMGSDCDFFAGSGALMPGSQVEIVEDGVSHIAVRSAWSLRFKIINGPKGVVFSTFWSFFRSRVKPI